MQNETTKKIYNLAILGGGPAGISAGVYAARKEINTVLITEVIGGQSTVSPDIHNWIGEKSISGFDLAEKFKNHIEEYASENFAIETGYQIETITDSGEHFIIKTKDGTEFFAYHLLYTLGSKRRTLDIPGSAEYEGRGVVYCASCDGPFFKGKEVCVIGGGNAAFESVLQLAQYCTRVTLINRTNEFKADQVTIDTASKLPNVTIKTNVTPTAITGELKVSAIELLHTESLEKEILPVSGVFIEIGQIPNTQILDTLNIKKNSYGFIEIDPWTQKTSHSRIWAAGDCTNVLFHQNNIASGDGVKAVEHLFGEITKK